VAEDLSHHRVPITCLTKDCRFADADQKKYAMTIIITAVPCICFWKLKHVVVFKLMAGVEVERTLTKGKEEKKVRFLQLLDTNGRLLKVHRIDVDMSAQ
jgi:hypothetical protein